MYAATMNQEKVVNYLLNKGANLKLQEFHGKTAMMFAASYGKVLTIKIFQFVVQNYSATNLQKKR